ncbi:MAG: APC family permease, partial [Candidatus Acidiferrales bacterium]
MLRRFKQFFIGSPLETTSLPDQRLGVPGALPVLASDNLSSAAYATDEILLGFLAAAAIGVAFPQLYALPIAMAICLLTLIVAISYGQTLHAYPTGGGAYTVAKENLGITPALVAGSALLIDYALTVAVSVAAGIAAITAAFPSLYSHRIGLCVLAVFLILVANLRGVRESAALFAGPVYLFIISIYALVLTGLWRHMMGGGTALPPAAAPAAEITWNATAVFFLLRAFASGCVALTGIEAVANGVRIFRPPASRNAAITLYIMAGFLATLFLGLTYLAYLYRIMPLEGQTVPSQLGRAIFGTS